MASGGELRIRAVLEDKVSGVASKIKDSLGKFGAVGVTAGTLLADAISKAAGALKDFVVDTVKTGMDFDKSMSQVAATMGTTTDQIGELRDFAQEMGRTTMFSATQAAGALNYMALAGYDADTSMKMLPNVLNLAAAGSMDLAAASDMVTDAQSALGLSIGQTEAMVDQMAKTASTTNTSVSQLGDAFLTVGGTAKMMKGGTAELSQVLGILADNGVKGSEGGTALRNILLSLSAPTNAAAGTLDALGVSVFDAEGNMRSMQDVMADLNAAMDGMTSEERTQAISAIFNKRDLKSVEALLGTNAERWNEVAEAIDSAKGSAEQMAKTQMDNLAGDVVTMQSAFEGVQITLSGLVMPALRVVVQFATEMMQGVTSLFEAHKDTFATVAEIIGGVLGAALSIAGAAFTALGEVIGVVLGILDPFIELNGKVFSTLKEAFSSTNEEASKGISLFQMLGDVLGIVANVIATVISPIIEMLCTGIKAVSFAVGKLSGFFSALWETVSSVWRNIVDTIKGAIDKIKGFFDFKIEWPHVPLPHFSVSPAGWQLGDLLEGSLPSLGIEWYAKGGYFDKPSIIGIGEAGPEMALPLAGSRMRPFAQEVARELGGASGGESVRYLAMIYALMQAMYQRMGQGMTFDGFIRELEAQGAQY